MSSAGNDRNLTVIICGRSRLALRCCSRQTSILRQRTRSTAPAASRPFSSRSVIGRCCVVAMLLALTGALAVLAQTVVLLLFFVFISTNLAVVVLRRDRVNHAHFRTPTALPMLAIASCLLLMTQQAAENWWRAGLLLAAGLLLYALSAARAR